MCILQGKLTYTSKALHKAQRPSKEDYMRYHLPYDIRARIISFGIRKRQMKHQYRRSRAGQNLFHHIAIISRRLKDTSTSIQNQTSRHENLIYPNLQTLKPNGIISLSHINARSVCNKTLELQTYITERSIDVCAITETWLRPDDQVTLPDITPSGYKAQKHLPSLVPGHQVSCLLCLSFCCSTIFVDMLLPSIGFVPPAGQSSIFPRQKLHICPHAWWGLSHGGLAAANSGEVKVNKEPRPLSEHQIVWTVPSNCGTGGIIGIQMWWPVGFFVFSQLPDHLHNCLVQSLYQPISLWVVGHGLQSFYAKDLAHFLNYTTHEASTSIT